MARFYSNGFELHTMRTVSQETRNRISEGVKMANRRRARREAIARRNSRTVLIDPQAVSIGTVNDHSSYLNVALIGREESREGESILSLRELPNWLANSYPFARGNLRVELSYRDRSGTIRPLRYFFEELLSENRVARFDFFVEPGAAFNNHGEGISFVNNSSRRLNIKIFDAE